MKKVFIFLLIFLTACGPSKPTITPTFNPVACIGNVCIKQTFVFLGDKTLRVQFDMVGTDGIVSVGESPTFTGKQLIAVFLTNGDSSETYLFGGNFPEGVYSCYTGNDIPWSNGKYASTCGLTIPASQLAMQIKSGVKVRVENATFHFTQNIPVQPETIERLHEGMRLMSECLQIRLFSVTSGKTHYMH